MVGRRWLGKSARAVVDSKSGGLGDSDLFSRSILNNGWLWAILFHVS